MMEPQMLQALMLLISALWGLVLLLGGLFLRSINSIVKDISKELKTLTEEVLRGYATKREVDIVQQYASDKVNEIRGQLQKHEVWTHLIAKETKVNLPQIDN